MAVDKRSLTSRENGKKGGRPVGSVAQKTLEKRAAQELARARITERLLPILDAQIESAIGISHFMLRDPKDGTWARITDPEEIVKAMNHPKARQGSTYLIYTKDPNNSAAKDLLDRALDRPKESIDMNVNNAEALAAKLLEGRRRAAERSKAKK